MIKRLRIFLGYIRRMPKRFLLDLSYIKNLKQADFNGKAIFYFGVPEHSNLGDLAQCYCIRRYLSENFSEYTVIEVPSRLYLDNVMNCRAYLKNRIKNQDIIVFQSGYCTQDIGGREDKMHQLVIKDYPCNRLVMLPQTVYFKSQKRKKLASDVYGSHKNLLFLARDSVSYGIAKEMFPRLEVLAYPDIVTTLIGRYEYNCEREGVLLCIRNDSEKFYSDEEINQLSNILHNITHKIDRLDTTIKDEYYVILKELKKYIEDYFQKFSRYEVVITDRYHGTIFSLIANTPVIVIKTNDHKVRTGVEWFKGVYDGSVFYADTLEDAYCIAAKLLSEGHVCRNSAYFSTMYYSHLKEIVMKKQIGFKENIDGSHL